MEKKEYPFIIGTAGHIDHGKTSLVRALSGVDTDRLLEEKRRGMTIELGFAPLELPSGKIVSIIDVPGHEKFIRQMVAGAAGMDAVMLVVAADDGVMPQTREHLEILSLLNIKNGITVVNKIDLVDEEMRAMAFEDTAMILRGTFLESKPIIGVSAVTGDGLLELVTALERMASGAVRRKRNGGFFLPVDRVFHMAGFGTVVTGTTTRGSLTNGDDVEVLPGGTLAKVRSIQVHNNSVERVEAGLRTAINISGVSLEQVGRGDVVAARGYYSATQCLDVRLEIPSSFGDSIKHWRRVRLHLGTSDVLARISLLDREKLDPGESAQAQILTESAICAYSGANFIVRSYSPVRTIGGGEVLLSLGARPRSKNARESLLRLLRSLSEANGDLCQRLSAYLEYRGVLSEADALKFMETDPRSLSLSVASLETKEKIVIFKATERYFISPGRIEEIKNRLFRLLECFHNEHPERKGMDAEDLSRLIQLPDRRLIKALVRRFAVKKCVTLDGDKVRLNDFVMFDEGEFLNQVEALRGLARKSGYAMPTIDEARAGLNIDAKTMSRVLMYLKDNKEAVIIGGEFIVFAFLEEDFKKKLSILPHDNITLAAVRDLTNSSRKYVLPLLEYFDSKGITRRVGDKRIRLKRLSGLI